MSSRLTLRLFLLTCIVSLSGCGYRGALYLPDEPQENTPPDTSAAPQNEDAQ